MSPEQILSDETAADLGPPTDVYGLCATFYELFTKHRVFHHDTQDVEVVKTQKLEGRRPDQPRLISPRISWELDTILTGGLEPSVVDRYRSMGDLARDLQHVLHAEPIAYRRPPLWRRIRLTYIRHRRVTNVTAALIGVVTVGMLIFGNSLYRLAEEQSQAQTALETSQSQEQSTRYRRALIPYRDHILEAARALQANEVALAESERTVKYT